MKNTFLLLALLIIAGIPSVFAQSALCDAASCYTADTCYASVANTTYTYAVVHNIYKNAHANVPLKMDVYSPCALPDTVTNTVTDPNCSGCKRPFILLIHGGGFRVACRTAMRKECQEFAKRGYVAATIDYRMGWVEGDELLNICNDTFCYRDSSCGITVNNCDSAFADSNQFAVYRALQDAHAAMRFITHFAANLNIDNRYLFIGGQSAGAITAVNIAYINAAELSNAMPGPASVLGELDTVGNAYTDVFKIAGVYNNWGSVIDTTLITGNADRIPMIAFHGTDDGVVPYKRANFLSCPYYDSSNGSYLIYKRLTNKYPGLPVELFACKGGHGIFETGTKATYRIEKAVCFFRNAKAGSTTTSLVERPENENNIPLDSLETWFPLGCGSGSLLRKMLPAQNEADFSLQGNRIACNYVLQNESRVEISIFDITGRKISAAYINNLQGSYTWLSEPITMPGVYIAITNINGRRARVQKIPISN